MVVLYNSSHKCICCRYFVSSYERFYIICLRVSE